MKKHVFVAASNLIILLFFSWKSFAGGILTANGLCPAPSITGVSQTLNFTLQGGLTHPDGIITLVTGTCNMNGQPMPPVSVLSASGISIAANFSYSSTFFEGLLVRDFVAPLGKEIFQLQMEYPGPVGALTDATPGLCSISVSWRDPLLVPTPISGPGDVRLNTSVELDGTVTTAIYYHWTTTGACVIEGVSNEAKVTVRGGMVGVCSVQRQACNDQNECVHNSHILTVNKEAVVTPSYILLLKE